MTTGRSAMQEVAPKMAEIAADVLFGDIWERPGLSKRDRSMITVAVLQALYRTGQLPGVTKDEIGEIMTHVAFYAGVPTAANMAGIAKAVYDERG